MNRYTRLVAAVLLLTGGLVALVRADDGINGLRNSDKPYICDRALQGVWERFNYGGQVYFGQHCGGVARPVTDRYGNSIRSDAPAPGVLFELTSSGQVKTHGVYDGDTWRGVLANRGNPGPQTYRANPGAVFRRNPNSPEQTRIVYLADANNRVVRDDGEYFREERIRGQWVRSESYGSDDEAKNRAEENARNRSQGRGLDEDPAEPPPSILLTSTSGQNTHGLHNLGKVGTDIDVAQAFTTGSNASGYKLTSVKLDLWVGTGTLPTYTVTIRSNFRLNSNNYPSATLGTLTAPSSLTNGLNTFTASGDGIYVAAGTIYWAVLDITVEATSLNLAIRRTASDAEDSGGAAGWSIADGFRHSDFDSNLWTDDSRTLKLEIHGYAK